jgi:hypothetical protein
MVGVAASVAFAGSVSLAALRLLTRHDKVHRRAYILITPTFWLYLVLHGIGAVVPFLVYWFWPNDWSSLFTASPWLVALLTPLVVNQILRLKGFDFPDATGPLSRFSNDVQRDFGHRMIDEQFAAMRGFIAPYAKGVNRFEAHTLASRNIPLQLPRQEADGFREAIATASTAEEVMELYIRHIGMNSFLFVFKKKEDEDLAQLLLFPDSDDAAREPPVRSSDRKAASE